MANTTLNILLQLNDSLISLAQKGYLYNAAALC